MHLIKTPLWSQDPDNVVFLWVADKNAFWKLFVKIYFNKIIIIYLNYFKISGLIAGIAGLTKVIAGKALAFGAKKALYAATKVIAKKGIRYATRHGLRWVKKKGFRWVKKRTMRWVRTKGRRWVKKQTYKWVKKQVWKKVRQQLNCSYRRYGGYYLPNRYPRSTGRQQFT